MKSLRFLLAVAFCGTLCPTLLADKPVFDSIDYASPKKYLVIADSLGDHNAISKQAKAPGSTPTSMFSEMRMCLNGCDFGL